MSFQLHSDLQRDGIELGSFPLSLVLLINDSNYPWFVLVPQRAQVRELIDLSEPDYQNLWTESAILSRTLIKLFAGDKLNVAALGNVTPQLHVHHIVRYQSDLAWPAPVWGKTPLQPYATEMIETIKRKLHEASMAGFCAR